MLGLLMAGVAALAVAGCVAEPPPAPRWVAVQCPPGVPGAGAGTTQAGGETITWNKTPAQPGTALQPSQPLSGQAQPGPQVQFQPSQPLSGQAAPPGGPVVVKEGATCYVQEPVAYGYYPYPPYPYPYYYGYPPFGMFWWWGADHRWHHT